jgi:hypothetical protein
LLVFPQEKELAMLATYSVLGTPRLARGRSRAPLRIYAPPAEDCLPETPAKSPLPRMGEVQPIGQLLPQVLARYLAQEVSK